MNLNVKKISQIVEGKIEKTSEESMGCGSNTIISFSEIENAKEGDLCFIANPKYQKYLYTTKATAVIINENLVLHKSVDTILIRVKDPYLAFTKILNKFTGNTKKKSGISKNATIEKDVDIQRGVYIGHYSVISKNAIIGEDVQIFPQCYVGENVKIENGSILYPGVKVYSNCIVGENNILHAASVIGSDGFGFAPNHLHQYSKINQIGNVVLEKNVEIGANTTIDRATLGSTIIKEGVKLDNQIQIGHNVVIGNNTVIAGHVAIAGSTKIGRNCMIGGNSSVSGHLNIGNGVKVAGHSAIGSNIADNQTVQGSFAFNLKDFQRSYIIFRRLPEMYKKLEKIYKNLN